MKRLYWKIVLLEGLLLVLLFGATMWGLSMAHQDLEARRLDDLAASRQLLTMVLRDDLPTDFSLDTLRKAASRTFKSKARILTVNGTEPTGPDVFRFKQAGTPYALIITDEADHTHDRDKFTRILFILVMVLGLLAIPFARMVTRPLGQLRQDMRRFATGDLGHRTVVASGDEVGDLARDFNDMAASIQRLVRIGREMTAHVSHELRSPLTRIDIARQLLEARLSGKDLTLLESMREDIAGMDELIDKILRLSRLDLNAGTPQPVDLTDIVDGVLRRYDTAFSAGAIRIHHELPASLSATGVQADLSCLVDNLLGNALKFTPQSGRIDIALEQDCGTALLTISNDAAEPRIDPARLIEPFQRGDTSESIPGSGLGLAIAARIVDMHAGGMLLSWNAGRFSATVRLPLSRMD